MLLRICTGPACTKNFSQYTLERAEVEATHHPKLQIETCGCLGQCEKGPNISIERQGQKNIHHRVNGVELKKILNKLD